MKMRRCRRQRRRSQRVHPVQQERVEMVVRRLRSCSGCCGDRGMGVMLRRGGGRHAGVGLGCETHQRLRHVGLPKEVLVLLKDVVQMQRSSPSPSHNPRASPHSSSCNSSSHGNRCMSPASSANRRLLLLLLLCSCSCDRRRILQVLVIRVKMYDVMIHELR
jgi:hypothetical protein